MGNHEHSIAIIGAGPAGTIAAAYLLQNNKKVTIIEKSSLPRFVIGESLLPQCMEIFNETDLLNPISIANFQIKNGADFYFNEKKCNFDFKEKISGEFGYTFQVERAKFDHLLLQEVCNRGAHYLEQTTVTAAEIIDSKVLLKTENKQKVQNLVEYDFVLDASGYGRVLANFFNLNLPAKLTCKTSIFTHLNASPTDYGLNQNNIAIISHPTRKACWFWLIPLEQNKCSIGTVVEMNQEEISNKEEFLLKLCSETPQLTWVKKDHFIRDVCCLTDYSKKVSTLHGDKFVLLGNAGDFLDPIFSSGVTVAAKSAQVASALVLRELDGEKINWQTEYSDVLQKGLEVFQTYIQHWYNGNLNTVFYNDHKPVEIKEKICSILAGYVWDEKNPLNINSERRLKSIVEVCLQ